MEQYSLREVKSLRKLKLYAYLKEMYKTRHLWSGKQPFYIITPCFYFLLVLVDEFLTVLK